MARMWTSIDRGAEDGAEALRWSCSLLQEVRPTRKTRPALHVTIRSRTPSEPSLAGNITVTLLRFSAHTQLRRPSALQEPRPPHGMTHEALLRLVVGQHAQASLQGHLILGNGAILQQPPQCGDLKPA